MLEAAIIEFKGTHFASWYNCHEKELSGHTPIRGKRSFDGGKIIAQKAVEVMADDTPETLQKRIMQQAEWIILPQAIDDIANNRI